MSVPVKSSQVVDFGVLSDFVVEVNDCHNRNLLWPIDQRVLRGSWRKENLPGVSYEDRFSKMPDLPGLYISVRPSQRMTAITDPLGNQDKHGERLAKAVACAKECGAGDLGPEKDKLYKDLSDNDLKSWIYWVRRFLDARQVRVVSGTVPEMQTIDKLPGKVVFGNFSTSGFREPSPANPYRPVAHEEGELPPLE